MNVLLSIRPQYVDAIINGNKKYEFRKKIFKNHRIDFVLVYASTPIKKIVGYFKLGDVIIDNPKNLWNKFSNESGLKENEFFEYFQNSELGYALDVRNFKPFDKPIDPRINYPTFRPPQSFCYIRSMNLDLDLT